MSNFQKGSFPGSFHRKTLTKKDPQNKNAFQSPLRTGDK